MSRSVLYVIIDSDNGIYVIVCDLVRFQRIADNTIIATTPIYTATDENADK